MYHLSPLRNIDDTGNISRKRWFVYIAVSPVCIIPVFIVMVMNTPHVNTADIENTYHIDIITIDGDNNVKHIFPYLSAANDNKHTTDITYMRHGGTYHDGQLVFKNGKAGLFTTTMALVSRE